MTKKPERLTQKDLDAINSALSFVLAGVAAEDEDSFPCGVEALETAKRKIEQRLK